MLARVVVRPQTNAGLGSVPGGSTSFSTFFPIRYDRRGAPPRCGPPLIVCFERGFFGVVEIELHGMPIFFSPARRDPAGAFYVFGVMYSVVVKWLLHCRLPPIGFL